MDRERLPGRPLVELLDEVLGEWSALHHPPDLTGLLYHCPPPARRSEGIFGLGLPVSPLLSDLPWLREDGLPELTRDPRGRLGRAAAEAGRRFTASDLFADLRAGKLVVEAPARGVAGWETVRLPPEFWAHASFAIWRAPPVLRERVVGTGRVRWQTYRAPAVAETGEAPAPRRVRGSEAARAMRAAYETLLANGTITESLTDKARYDRVCDHLGIKAPARGYGIEAFARNVLGKAWGRRNEPPPA